jgi:hypothetical protein
MSVLRNIIMFMLFFQLALQLTNYIQIQGPSASLPNGLYLSTGEITPFTIWYDPMSDILNTLNETQQALNPIIPTSCNSSSSTCSANYLSGCSAALTNASCSSGWVYYHNMRWNCIWATDYFNPAGRCELSTTPCDCTGSQYVTYIYRFLNAFSISWTIDANAYFYILNYNTGLPSGMIMNAIGLGLFLIISAANISLEFLLIFVIVILNVTIGAIPFYSNLFGKIDPVMGGLLGVCLGGIQMLVIAWEVNKEAGKIVAMIAGVAAKIV